MPRERSPNRDKAFDIYKKHKGNIKNKDIAKILNEDPKTVSKWKTLDEWEERINSKNKKKNSKFEEDNNKYSTEQENIEIENDLNEIIENIELTDKQILFCIYYIQSFNATKAYQKAYGCSKVTASVNGCKLLSNTNIRITISSLKQNRMNRAMISQEDVFQKYMDIAFADITDYIEFGKKDIIVGKEEDGTPIYKKVNYTDYKDSTEIDGTLIREFKEGQYGISIKLMDSLKALNWIAEHMDMATEEQKARIESIKNKMEIERERFKHQKEMDERSNF